MNEINKRYLVCDKKGGYFRFLKLNYGKRFIFKKSKSFLKLDETILKNSFGVIIFYYDDEDVLEIMNVINLNLKNVLVCSFDKNFLTFVDQNRSLKTLHLDKLNEELKVAFNFKFNFT